jgi:spore germination protein KB
MVGKEKIAYHQFAILVLMFTIGTSIIIAPSTLAMYAQQDGWISALFGMAVGLSVVWGYAAIGKYFMNRTLIEAIQFSFGKYLGFPFSFIIIGFSLILSSLVLSNVGNFVNTRMLVGTPLDAIEYIFVLIAVIGIRFGIETLSRATEFILPLFVFLFLFFCFAVLPQIELINIKPIFEHDIKLIIRSSYGFITFPFGELFLFLMITPFISKREKIKKGYLLGTIIGGTVLVIITVLSIFSLGGEGTAIDTYPAFALAKKIDVAGVIQRIEVIMAGIWMFSIFTKLSVCVFTTALGMKQLFKMRDLNCLTIPIAIILIPLSQWLSPNASDFQTYTQHWMYLFTFAVMVIPFLTTLVLYFRRKFSKGKKEPNE